MSFTYTWRPAAFEAGVSHYAIDGQTPRLYGGIIPGMWVLSVCGQSVFPFLTEDDEEQVVRCERCRAWISGENARKPPTPGPR